MRPVHVFDYVFLNKLRVTLVDESFKNVRKILVLDEMRSELSTDDERRKKNRWDIKFNEGELWSFGFFLFQMFCFFLTIKK